MSSGPSYASRYTRFPPQGRAAEPESVTTQPIEIDESTQVIPANKFFWLAPIFIFSLLLPIQFHVGPLLLTPFRLVLLVSFVPALVLLAMGRAGRFLAIDGLVMFSTLWVLLAFAVNHPIGTVFEAMGIYVVEFLGAYLLGRVAIRSGADFVRFARSLFLAVLFLMPFAILESVTHRPWLIDLIPGGTGASGANARFGLRRAQTAFVHPILFGAFASSALGLAWFTLKPAATAPLRAAIVIVTTVCSLSTGALIALVSQIGFIGYETILRVVKSRWKIFAVGVVIMYIVIDLLSNRSPFHVLVDYASFSTGSAYNRILIWDWGTKSVAANPFFGIGLNDWARPSWMSSSVDNYWLLIAMRYGLPAAFAYMAAVIILIRQSARAVMSDDQDRGCRAGFLVSLGGIAIAGGTVHYWLSIGAFVPFFIGAGVWMAEGSNILKFRSAPDGPDQPLHARSPETGRSRPDSSSRRGAVLRAHAASGSESSR